jgi:DNA polymerase-4
MASDMEKPDGLTILTEADIPAKVWPQPVRKLLGVGPKTEARLIALGVKTIGALAAVPLPMLQEHFGEVHGRHLHEAAHGIDESPLIATWEPHSLSRQITFQQNLSGKRAIARELKSLVQTVLADAREEGYLARTVSIKVRFADFETLSRQVGLSRPSNASSTITRAARECLKHVVLVKKVRLIGVRLSNLVPAEGTRHEEPSTVTDSAD